ncbi:MAG: ABC transporter permease [Anaerolineales bacterium]|nr:ABC transporter permease [Anaerolineales bacterium]
MSRRNIVLAKFAVTALWCALLAAIIYGVGLVFGVILQLPGGSIPELWQGVVAAVMTTVLVIPVVLPFALVASIGRGYLLPIGAAILTMMFVNFSLILGLGESFPWAIPLIYAQGEITLAPFSYLLVMLTGIVGVAATVLWWKYADQSK